MGNASGKESRSHAHSNDTRAAGSSQSPTEAGSSHGQDGGRRPPVYLARANRSSRHDLGFLGIGASAREDAQPEQRRETKAEREARKLEKERELRRRERERSLKEEGVDGGYLVTLGTYTGPEDFSKSTVRQLQVCCGLWSVDAWMTLTRSRLSGGWHLSGEDSMITRTHGRSTNWSLSRRGYLFQRPMKYHLKTLHGVRPNPARGQPTSPTSLYLSTADRSLTTLT